MAGYTNLIEAMQAVIKRNGREEITGQILQDVIRGVILELGAGAQFGGIATTETDPGTPDYDIAYIAGEGEYTNFGGLTVPFGSIGIITNKNATEEHPWSLTLMEIPTNCMVVESVPDGDINALNNHYYNVEDDVEALNLTLPTPTAGRTNKVKVHFIAGFTPTLNIDGGEIPVVYPEIELKHHRDYIVTLKYDGNAWKLSLECLTPENCLTFQNKQAFAVQMSNVLAYNGRLEYSTNLHDWHTLSGAGIMNSQRNGIRHKVYVRGENNTYIKGYRSLIPVAEYGIAVGNNTQCVGNINTLLNYKNPDNVTYDNGAFSRLFVNSTGLILAPDLPQMELTQSCYEYMFKGCTLLKHAPDLPATTLPNTCYREMFNGCTLLESVKMMATTLGSNSLNKWLQGVAAEGTFTKDATMADLPSGANGIPNGWTVVDV